MEVGLLLKLLILAVCTNLLSGYPLQFQQGIYNGANLLSSYQNILPQYHVSRLSSTIPYYSTGDILPNTATVGKLVRAETATYVPAGSLVMLPSMTRDTGLPVTSPIPITDPITGQILPTGSVIPGTGGLPVSSPLGSPACALAGALGNVLTNNLCCGPTLSLPCLGNGLLNNGLIGGGLTPGLTPGWGDLGTLLTAYSLLQNLGGLGGLGGGLGGLGGGLGGGCQCNSGLQIQLPTCCQPSILPVLPIPVPISGPSALPDTAGMSTSLPVTTPITPEDSSPLPVTIPVTTGDSTPSITTLTTSVDSTSPPITTPVNSVSSTSSPVLSTTTTGPVTTIIGGIVPK